MTRKTVLIYLGVALLFGALGIYLGIKTKPAEPEVGTVAPSAAARTPVEAMFAQSMNDASGGNQSLARWKGKALVVNFWAPWCAPCVEEMPELDRLAIDSLAKDINIIGIGIDSPNNIAEFAAKHKISYPLYVAGMSGTDLARDFGNKGGGLPFTVLIGADGKIVKTYLGRLKFAQLKADLAALKS